MTKPYNSFKYIYPPRPETKSSPSAIKTFERMGFWAQPKLNGSCGVLFLDGMTQKIMGRHNNYFTREAMKNDVLVNLHRGNGNMVLCGEYMNKSQKNSKGKPFLGFVIFDILVYENEHLVGTTFEYRQKLLDKIYPKTSYEDGFISKIGDFMYRALNFTSNLEKLWNDAVKVEMFEGFVFKNPNGLLENGLREANNTKWQIKIRKETKNYSY